jgi:serine-protein kinase ATM
MVSVRDAAHSLLLVEDVYLAGHVLAQSQRELVGRSARAAAGPSSAALPSVGLRDRSSVARAGAHFKEMREGLGVPVFVLKQAAGATEGGAGAACGSLDDDSHPALARFLELNAMWKRRDKSTVYSPRAAMASPESMETVLSLRVALARALGIDQCVGRMSAELATSVLLTDAGKGAWSRAAAALGSFGSVGAMSASKQDAGAWRLAEARLCWQASEDGNSKQEALRAVMNVIRGDLGGSLVRIDDPTTDDSTPKFAARWDCVDGAQEDPDTLALLRAEACCLASTWSALMRAEEPMVLFRGLLEMGLAAFPPEPAQADGKCKAHYAMAEFADRQLMSIQGYRKTKEYAFRLQNVSKIARTIAKLEKRRGAGGAGGAGGASLSPAQEKAIARFIAEAEREMNDDNKKIDKIDALQRNWELLAAQHYAACLTTGALHDLRAACRLVNLWTEAGVSCQAMNDVLLPPDGLAGGDTFVPTSKLLPLAPQIASRITKSGGDRFERTLAAVFTKMTVAHPAHCLWLLVALSNLTRPAPVNQRKAALYVGDEDKKGAADEIIAAVRRANRRTVEQTLLLADQYFAASEIPGGQKHRASSMRILTAVDLDAVPVPTRPLPLHGYNSATGAGPTVAKFDARTTVLGGQSTPLLVTCVGSDGHAYPQVVKYADDMRQDAVMEQLFAILNELLASDGASSVRNLHIRTYRVVPLSPFAGVMQFVRDTEALKEYLVGEGKGRSSAHARHRPHDMSFSEINRAAHSLHMARKPIPVKVRHMKSIWPKFRPVFRYFFFEKFPDPAEWHARQLSYTRSAAVMSIVGWMIGLGDRHLSNILLDRRTAELIHIDFGYVFETSKLLPAPEHMPFRLTRDVVDGMGIDGVEGVFRKSCEVTMQLLRNNKDLVLMVVAVFLHDPLYDWSFTPLKVIRDQLRQNRGDDEDVEDGDGERRTSEDVLPLDDDEGEDEDESRVGGSSAGHTAGSREVRRRPKACADVDDRNDKAMHALSVVSEKLEGLESTDRLSVEAHVARLIDVARSIDVIASAYIGWSPFV